MVPIFGLFFYSIHGVIIDEVHFYCPWNYAISHIGVSVGVQKEDQCNNQSKVTKDMK